jgi:hypothetical protein
VLDKVPGSSVKWGKGTWDRRCWRCRRVRSPVA